MNAVRVRRLWAAVTVAALAIGCGKKGAPSGGPPDLEPPRLIAATPDSAEAGVALGVSPTLTFSEGMEPRSTGDAISISPPVEIRRLRWSGRTVTAVLAESLRADRTYTLFVGAGARDRHGNPVERAVSIVFATGDSFPPGRIHGRIEARGFPVSAANVWCYQGATGREPDSTARDFDALGLVSPEGRFDIVGLPVPADYRLWVFVDLNGNRSFEPVTDVLAAVDTVLALRPAAPSADSVVLRIVNPRAPAVVKGSVLDSLPEREGTLLVMAVADTDTTERALANVSENGDFEIALESGDWTLRAFRDLDRNRVWDRVHEPASAPIRHRAAPAESTVGVVLKLEPARGSP